MANEAISIPEHIIGATTPVACVGVFAAKPGRQEALLREIRAVLAPVRAEPGCEQYEFHVADDDTIVLYERWSTGPDLLAHGAQPHMAAYFAAIADLCDLTPGRMSVRWLEPVGS